MTTDELVEAIDHVLTEHPAPAGKADPWRLAEWSALPDVCLFGGCASAPDDIDERGPVFLRDGGIHKACTEHWEPIMRVLGEQASWESGDAMRAGEVDG